MIRVWNASLPTTYFVHFVNLGQLSTLTLKNKGEEGLILWFSRCGGGAFLTVRPGRWCATIPGI